MCHFLNTVVFWLLNILYYLYWTNTTGKTHLKVVLLKPFPHRKCPTHKLCPSSCTDWRPTTYQQTVHNIFKKHIGRQYPMHMNSIEVLTTHSDRTYENYVNFLNSAQRTHEENIIHSAWSTAERKLSSSRKLTGVLCFNTETKLTVYAGTIRCSILPYLNSERWKQTTCLDIKMGRGIINSTFQDIKESLSTNDC